MKVNKFVEMKKLIAIILAVLIALPTFATPLTAYGADNDLITQVTIGWGPQGELKLGNNIEKGTTPRSFDGYIPDTANSDTSLNLKANNINITTSLPDGADYEEYGYKVVESKPGKINQLANATAGRNNVKLMLTNPKLNEIKPGQKYTYTIQIGIGKRNGIKFTETPQEYKLNMVSKVMLSDLAVSEGEKNLSLNKTFNNLIEDVYAVSIDPSDIPIDDRTITINCTPKTPYKDKSGTTLIYTLKDGSEVKVTQEQFDVNLGQLKVNTDGKKVLPLKLVYNDAEGNLDQNTVSSKYELLIEEKNYTPALDCNSLSEFSYDRAATPESLYAKAVIDESSKGEISYQWYKKESNRNVFIEMPEAKTDTLIPETEYVGECKYKCLVTNTVSGADYPVESKVFSVIVNPTSASKPIIKKDLEDATIIRGETKELSIEAATNDYKGHLSYQWYKADNPEGQNPVKLNDINKPFTDIHLDSVGTEYYFCRVTNTVGYSSIENSVPIGGYSAFTDSKICRIDADIVPGLEDFEVSGANGTEEAPYIIKDLNDLNKVRAIVDNGYGLENIVFKLENDITLPAGWEPIGALIDKSYEGQLGGELMGKNVHPFMGIFDGAGHKIVIPDGGRAPFRYVRCATIRNLNIYGKNIIGSAFVDNLGYIDYGIEGEYETVPKSVFTIDNCRLLEGSKTSGAGFAVGCGSGANKTFIKNSVVEKNTVINGPGSFINFLNGRIDNCVSYATVNGSGGIVGYKGASMGDCTINNCAFIGTLNSKGDAGGIIGNGYNGYVDGVNSAPNTPVVSVTNCYVVADITGNGSVGGILGEEPSCECCWTNGKGSISNNYFYGTLKETSGKGNVGGIVGYLRSYNKYQEMHDNFYIETSGAKKGIGKIEEIITKDHPKYGAEFGLDKRFDDNAVCTKTVKKDFENGKVVAKLNSGKFSNRNWEQGKAYPILSDKPVIYKITLEGDYKTDYIVGDSLDTEGMVFKGIYTDGKSKTIPVSEIIFTNFNSEKPGDIEVNAQYQSADVDFKVKVRYANADKANVSVKIYGDDNHGEANETTGVHTMADNNLQLWYEGTFEVTQNNNVWDVLQLVSKKSGIIFSNPLGNYIDLVTKGNTKLGEFTNGPLSGWMYTLNGKHPNLGVSEQFLNDGDEIVFHYTDDYTKEEGSEGWGPAPENPAGDAKVVDNQINRIGEVTLESEDAVESARAAYEALSDKAKSEVKNLAVLEAAEAKLAVLKEAKTVDDSISAIGEATLESEEAIKAARAAYNALSDEAKAEVKNLAVLEAAEAKLEELKGEQTEPEKPAEPEKPLNPDGTSAKVDPEGGWKVNSTGWWFETPDGEKPYLTDEFAEINGKMYHFDKSGYMSTGWVYENGAWYYFEPQTTSSGPQGAMADNGWRWIGNECFYLGADGKMAADSMIGGSYVDERGAWVPGTWQHNSTGWWLNYNGHYPADEFAVADGSWYYFNNAGYMVTGWKQIDGKWYYFSGSGAMVSGGWTWIGNKCYYFYENGEMASGITTPDGYTVDESGAWIQ